MTEKELRKLNKTDLLEILLQQSQMIQELRQKNRELEENLKNTDKMLHELKECIHTEIHQAIREILQDTPHK